MTSIAAVNFLLYRNEAWWLYTPMVFLSDMPFLFGKKDEPKVHFMIDNITDKNELEEIRKIANRLDQDEKVRFVAKQSRVRPGGSALATPNIVFATDKRIIIRNPTMLGMRENIEYIPYDKMTSVKLEKGVFSSTILIRVPGLSEMSRVGKSSGLIAWDEEKMDRLMLCQKIRENGFLQLSGKA